MEPNFIAIGIELFFYWILMVIWAKKSFTKQYFLSFSYFTSVAIISAIFVYLSKGYSMSFSKTMAFVLGYAAGKGALIPITTLAFMFPARWINSLLFPTDESNITNEIRPDLTNALQDQIINGDLKGHDPGKLADFMLERKDEISFLMTKAIEAANNRFGGVLSSEELDFTVNFFINGVWPSITLSYLSGNSILDTYSDYIETADMVSKMSPTELSQLNLRMGIS